MEKLTAMVAIKKFLDAPFPDGSAPQFKTGIKELQDFLKVVTPEEKRAYAKDACAVLGCELQE